MIWLAIGPSCHLAVELAKPGPADLTMVSAAMGAEY